MEQSGYHEELELALKAREQYLKEYPELQPFQDEIDRILAKAENRLEALSFLIEKKLFELGDALADLQSFLRMQYKKGNMVNANVIFGDYHGSTGHLN